MCFSHGRHVTARRRPRRFLSYYSKPKENQPRLSSHCFRNENNNIIIIKKNNNKRKRRRVIIARRLFGRRRVFTARAFTQLQRKQKKLRVLSPLLRGVLALGLPATIRYCIVVTYFATTIL